MLFFQEISNRYVDGLGKMQSIANELLASSHVGVKEESLDPPTDTENSDKIDH